MTDLLVTMILAVCPPSLDGGTNACMENITNCAVGKSGKIEPEAIVKCVEEYENGVATSSQTND